MKKAIISLLTAAAAVAVLSCRKSSPQDEPVLPREPDIPELVESELTEALSHDWKALADTLDYFNRNFLLKGRTGGKGPDGVYYRMDAVLKDKGVDVSFSVEDSLFVKAYGSISPMRLAVKAFNDEMTVYRAEKDSLGASVGKVDMRIPAGFLSAGDKKAELYFSGGKVAYVEKAEFENLDYSREKNFIVRYYGDERTFSFFESGFSDFLKLFNAR